MSLRRTVLWVTGRDLLKPKILLRDSKFIIGVANLPQNWRFRLAAGGNFIITTDRAPNILHRVMQRLILGIQWELKCP